MCYTLTVQFTTLMTPYILNNKKNRKTNEIFGSRLKGVHEEIYNFHIVPPVHKTTRYVYAYKNCCI